MKRFAAMLIAVVLMLGSAALATDLDSMTKEELIAMIEELTGGGSETTAPAETETPGTYTDLQKGSKGDEVEALQQRLKDLGYLSGSVDGDYGNGTAGAVSSFQSQAGLSVTGNADAATQEAIFAEDAPKAIVYEELDYTGVSRDPDNYTGRYVKFNGKVLQVMEDDDTVSFRVATSGNYDDVVYVVMTIPDNYSRILEDDKITVSGMYAGLLTYKTVMGASVTIPNIMADLVTLR